MQLPHEKTIVTFMLCVVAIFAFEANRLSSRDEFDLPEERTVLSGQGSGAHDNWHMMPDIENPPALKPNDLIYNNSRNTVPIVNEEYKVIFFLVAKAASSEWIRFFIRLEGLDNWCGHGCIHDKYTNGLTYLTDYPVEKAQEMMTSPEWTRAIFVRNPKPRILSAFLDKAVQNSNHFVQNTCKVYSSQLGGEDNEKSYEECVRRHEDFEFFLRNITTTLRDNVHWRSIFSRIDEKWWPWINYIANMEELSEDAEHFLKTIHSTIDGMSAWDRIGKTGWSDNERDCDMVGKNAFLAKKDTRHKTNARDKMLQYYTPELELFIEEHFADDLNNPYFRFSELTLYEEEGTYEDN